MKTKIFWIVWNLSFALLGAWNLSALNGWKYHAQFWVVVFLTIALAYWISEAITYTKKQVS
jgi:hypothetical protein